ncbi:MAG: tetratricopeptide repeat protein [Bacteroidales bacterium]
MHNLSAWISYFEENKKKGIEACLTAIDLNPDFSDTYWLFALHYTRLGQGDKTAEVLRDLFQRYPSVSHLGEEVMDAYREAGTDGIFSWLIEVNMNRPFPVDGLTGNPFFIAWWYAIIGDREQAAIWLEKTMDAQYVPWHYGNLTATNPDFDILRNDPRYIAFIRKAGLAQYNTRPSK